MPYTSKIPAICSQASLKTQAAVERAGQQVEFLALQRAAMRRRTGQEMGQIKWVPNKRNPHQGRVVSGFVTRFHEYGTVHMAAHPTLGPAAEETEPAFLAEMQTVYRVR